MMTDREEGSPRGYPHSTRASPPTDLSILPPELPRQEMKSTSRPCPQLLALCSLVAGLALVVVTGTEATAYHRPMSPVPTAARAAPASSRVTSSQAARSPVVFVHHVAEWNVLCPADHYGMDDPLMFPGDPGMSHMHTFYGNTSTDADSTISTLSAASPSSCGRGMGTSDLSAYWVPSLMRKNKDGTSSVVKSPQLLTVYYRRPGGGMGPGVRPFPVGLSMIAGNSMATSDQSLKIVQWDCGGGGLETPHMHACPKSPSTEIHASVVFPSCWDGVHLDSADHKSHMAYPARNGTCPASHPVSLPQVTFEIDFPGIFGGRDYHLASGGIYSLHGDFIADWHNRVQNALVASCLNIPRECGDMNRDGHWLFRPTYDPEPIRINLDNFPPPSPYYASCRALHRDFPHGVAKGRRAAAKQVRDGFGRPAFGPHAREVYWANHRSLDPDRDGTACEA
jgi:hypothetical protein